MPLVGPATSTSLATFLLGYFGASLSGCTILKIGVINFPLKTFYPMNETTARPVAHADTAEGAVGRAQFFLGKPHFRHSIPKRFKTVLVLLLC